MIDIHGNHIPRVWGTIREASNAGLAMRIVWENGLEMFRSGDEIDPPPERTIFDIGGTCLGNNAVPYFFAQVDRSFSWAAPTLGHSGIGEILDPDSESGTTDVKIFTDRNGHDVLVNWDNISAQDASGVREMYRRWG